MIPTTSYKAFDGSVFNTPKECADYETHCRSMATIIDKLPRFPVDEDFATGKTFYQHDPRVFLPIRDEFFIYLDDYYNNPKLQYPEIRLSLGESVLIKDRAWWHEMFTKHNDSVSLLAWRWIGYTDNYYRQWGQMMFAIKPPEQAIQINQ